MEQIRAFIAIELPEALKAEIARLQEQLRARVRVPTRWVNPDNIHLTLKFLGDINRDTVDDILHAIGAAAGNAPSFRLGVKGLGVFPDPQRPRIIWVGLTGGLDKLRNLQRDIDNSLERLGFPREKRPFSPHLTIARLHDRATPADRSEIGHIIKSTTFIAKTSLNAGVVYLIKSQLTREGPIYSQLGSAELG